MFSDDFLQTQNLPFQPRLIPSPQISAFSCYPSSSTHTSFAGMGDIITTQQRNIEELGFPEELHGKTDGLFLDLPGPWHVCLALHLMAITFNVQFPIPPVVAWIACCVSFPPTALALLRVCRSRVSLQLGKTCPLYLFAERPYRSGC